MLVVGSGTVVLVVVVIGWRRPGRRVVGPGTVVDADSLTVRHTYVAVGPSAEPGAPVVFRVQLAGRMCYGQIEARWSSL